MKQQFKPIGMYAFIRPLLFTLPPEIAHHLSLQLLEIIGNYKILQKITKNLFSPNDNPCYLFEKKFKNKIGIAAGYDKNAIALKGLESLGIGHIEIGTITPYPQKGNQKPRIIRVKNKSSLINNMGFPNDGLKIISQRIENYRKKDNHMIIGANIGKNKNTPNNLAFQDYLNCFERLKDIVDYIAINISSPNTPGLQELQKIENIEKILSPILNKKSKTPVLVKLSPDLNDNHLLKLIEMFIAWNVDGVILSNTKIGKNYLGGKSGLELRNNTFTTIKKIRNEFNSFPIIASGGIGLNGDLKKFINAGASLVQIWTSLIYRGPNILSYL